VDEAARRRRQLRSGLMILKQISPRRNQRRL
jgi:hypothetical protein